MEIIKPLIDTNEYKHITLDNKLDVLLIYDKNTDKSACSMNVNVGFYNDPIDSQGIAHFLEHMLFMGTKKFPKENHYHDFINNSGGMTNAHTMEESTTYYFEVLNEYFLKAIDIFAQFFIEPLLSENAVNREINAVNSEFRKNCPMDIVRVIDVLKDNIDIKTHPYYNFGSGNKETLSKHNIRDILKDFYNKYYSSNIMRLVILSNISLDIIEPTIIKIFTDIPNKNIGIPCKINVLEKNLFGPFTQHKIINFVPIQQLDILYIFWQIPNMDKYYKYKPMEYIFHLLGHTGKGSIFDVLKEIDYCTSVNVGVYESDTSFHLMGMQIELTKKGFKHTEKIISCVESYIKIIKDSIINDLILNEIKILNNIYFNYSVIHDKITYVSNLSMNMIKYDVQDIIYGDYVINIEEKTKELINSCLQHISIEKSIIIISSKNFKKTANLKSKWYGAKFIYANIKKDILSEDIKNKLQLPIQNEFIPHDLKLLPVYNVNLTSQNDIWYKSDTYNVPKVFIDIMLYTNKINENPINYLLFEMYLSLFEYYNHDKLVYARACETGYYINNDNDCIIISFYGFNNNIHKITELFINTFFTFIEHITENIFDFTKNHIISELDNHIYESLSILAGERIRNAIYLKYYSNETLKNIIGQINFSDINKPKKWLYKNCNMKSLIYGNISKEIVSLTNKFNIFKIDDKINIPKNESNKIIDLHNGESQVYIIKSQNLQDNNYLIDVFFEVGHIIKKVTVNWELSLLCTMFMDMFVKEKFFTQLRTKEQSGYIVRSYARKFINEKGYLYGISFMVQSPHINPSVLKKRIKKFINTTHVTLLKLKQKKLDLYKNNIKLSLQKKLVSQYEERASIISEIVSDEYAFDYKKILINNIDLLNLDILVKFYETYFINKNTRKVRVCEIYKKNEIKNEYDSVLKI